MTYKSTLGIIFCFFISQMFCWAQTAKGIWTTGGSFQFEVIRSQGERVSSVVVQPELGYAFHNKWMLWGRINIELEDRLSIVGQRLNLRYAFLKMKPIEGFVGVDYERVERRFLVQGGTTKRVALFIGPFAGYQHFLNKNTALEFELRYPIYRHIKVGETVQKYNGSVLPRISLRFFFDSKLESDSIPKKYQLSQKRWLIGGTISLSSNHGGYFGQTQVNNKLTPYAGYLFSKKWMLGIRLVYSNSLPLDHFEFGLDPFCRYYFRQVAKNMFYGEVNTNFHLAFLVNYNRSNETKWSQRAGGIGLGWGRWIVPNVCLDLQFGSQWSESLGVNLDRLIFAQSFYLRLGLESYL